MKVSRVLLKISNLLVSAVVVLFLLAVGGWSAYALWDNVQVYSAAVSVQTQLLALKPEMDPESTPEAIAESFEELRALNPDTVAWLTLDGTAIDFPIVQGEDNMTYINTDVYGNFSMSGSIFLDSNCDASFREPYALVYGHHMSDHVMFTDLDLYKDENFFRSNTTGTLALPDRVCRLKIFACLIVPSSEDHIYNPSLWRNGVSGLLQFSRENALFLNEEVLSRLEGDPNAQVLALSTCSSEFTNARTIVLAAVE